MTVPSFTSSNEPAKIPDLAVFFKLLDSKKFKGIKSSIFFQSLSFPKNSLILYVFLSY